MHELERKSDKAELDLASRRSTHQPDRDQPAMTTTTTKKRSNSKDGGKAWLMNQVQSMEDSYKVGSNPRIALDRTAPSHREMSPTSG